MASDFDQILDELESRWNRDTEVELLRFLSEHGVAAHDDASSPETSRLLLESVQIDLERRWMSRGRLSIPCVDDYLAQFPILNVPEYRVPLEDFDLKLRGRFCDPNLQGTPQFESTVFTNREAPHETFRLSRDEFAQGESFGPYRIVQKIGEGGMGAIYQAVQEHLGKTVAIKVLSPKWVHDKDVVSRFRREMKAMGLVEHPNVVRAMDAGEIDGTHYLATEFVDGTDLSKHVQSNGPVSVGEAIRIIVQASEALSSAHALGLVHRDIKPSNLMLTASGQIKLLDLGLTRLVSVNEQLVTELTEVGNTFGTPDYMAPEQWEDAREADSRTDLYALGCTLFFLLIGRAPFATDRNRSAYSKMKAHADSEIPDATNLREGVPAELSAIIRKLLAKRREERFQTAAELISALNSAQPSLVEGAEPRTARFSKITNLLLRLRSKRLVLGLSITAGCIISGYTILERRDNFSPLTETSPPPSHEHTRRSGRDIAEEVLKRGGMVTIELHNNSFDIHDLSRLPVEDLVLRSVHISNAQGLLDQTFTQLMGQATDLRTLGITYSDLSDDDTAFLEQLSNLENLCLWHNPKVTKKTVDRLRNLRNLRTLELSSTNLGPNGLDGLTDHTLLERLTVPNCGLRDEDLRALQQSTRLRTLEVAGFPLTNRVLEAIANHRELTDLYLREVNLSDEHLRQLSTFPNLSTLDLTGTQVTDAGIEALTKLPQLRVLNLNHTNLTGRRCSHLAAIRRLETLYLSSTGMDDSVLEQFPPLPGLRMLAIDHNPLSSQSLKNLERVPNLEELNVYRTNIDDDVFEHLVRLTRLKSLIISETRVTQPGIDRLHKHRPSCHITWDGGVIEPEATSSPVP